MTPFQASSKKNEGIVLKKFLDKGKKIKQKLQVIDLVRTANLRKTLSKSDSTNLSYKLCELIQIINYTKPSYHIDNLSERYNEALLKKTELTVKENNSVMKN